MKGLFTICMVAIYFFACTTNKAIYIDIPGDSTTYTCNPILGQKLILHLDTLINSEDGSYAIGQVGKCHVSDRVGFKIGKWTKYYASGVVKCQGNYGFSILRNCGPMGYGYDEYCYKLGRWVYYYEDRTIEADILYDTIQKWLVSPTCGDTVYFKTSVINSSSQFFNTDNKLITADSSLIKYYLGEDEGITVE
ncbi:hypothetical protein [Parasegetibacter sp. NRK P23]|uniref:hypothetical protein n=1 Tax=Parasegetibacter sp. NRK P23 TaxID=2942999 RepID=UPI002043159A|nr:hypothetical protein [Parasegetibacter sp. NRK P23]MCM5530322.1 hypothetical protein [Parasegetibacter sp. NRK P23]